MLASDKTGSNVGAQLGQTCGRWMTWTCLLSLVNVALIASFLMGPLVLPIGSAVAAESWARVQPPAALCGCIGIFLGLAAVPLRDALAAARRALRLRPAKAQTRDDAIQEEPQQRAEKEVVIPRLDLSRHDHVAKVPTDVAALST